MRGKRAKEIRRAAESAWNADESVRVRWPNPKRLVRRLKRLWNAGASMGQLHLVVNVGRDQKAR